MSGEPAGATLTPEQKLLLWAVLPGDEKDPQASELLRGKVDWARLRQLALEHSLLPLLYRRLKSLGQDLTPAAAMDDLQRLYLYNAGTNLQKEQLLLRTLDILAGRGIEAVPLKGPILAMQAYGDLSLRSFTDLDILIRRQDFRPAYNLLTAAGYVPQFPVTGKREKWLLQSDIELRFTARDILLELHWEVTENFSLLDLTTEHLWQRLQTFHLNGRELRVLAPGHTILMLWLHGTAHRWEQLKWVADLAWLASACPAEEWSALLEEGNRLPPGMRERFLADMGNLSALARAALDHDRSKSFRDHVREAAERLFRPRAPDWMAVELPDRLYPLYCLFRPVRLLCKYSLLRLGALFSGRQGKNG